MDLSTSSEPVVLSSGHAVVRMVLLVLVDAPVIAPTTEHSLHHIKFSHMAPFPLPNVRIRRLGVRCVRILITSENEQTLEPRSRTCYPLSGAPGVLSRQCPRSACRWPHPRGSKWFYALWSIALRLTLGDNLRGGKSSWNTNDWLVSRPSFDCTYIAHL